MRELHVVAVSDDGQSVVLATSRGATRGGYRVAIDDRLTSAVLGDLAGGDRPTGDVTPVDVTPKEIQARVRAGESVEHIAATAGVPIAKIERYAGPVLSEIARVLDEARSGYVSRSRLGASALPLGRAVDQHLAGTTGVRLETVTWSARRDEAGTWLVQVSYVSQARRRTATWRYDVARREVTATDSPSAQLAHVDPGRAARGGDAPPPAAPARATPAAKRLTPQSRRPASEPTRRTAPAARTVVARPDEPRRLEVDLAAQAAARAERAAAAQTAEADRALAAARAAELSSAEHAAARRAEQDALDAQARRRAKAEAERAAARRAEAAAARTAADHKAGADAARTATAEAARKAKADAVRMAKAEAARKAKAEAARKAEAEEARKATAEAARTAKAEAARRAKAEAARRAAAARKNAAAAVQEAAQLEREAEQARVDDEQVPSGPPTLRVVGGDEVPRRRRTPKPAPVAARAEPARVAGQRASVPGWADVLLSTAPVRSPDPQSEQD